MTQNSRVEQQSDDQQQLAAEQVIASEKLCAAIPISAGARVLDIGCGTGSSAIAAGRRRAVVTAIDIDEQALARARVRAAAEGVPGIDFLNIDATAMPFDDGSFDVVVSTLALVFLPDQEAVARDLARVVRPGGTIALTALTRGSVPGQIYDMAGEMFPSPHRPAHAHYDWSDGKRVKQLLNPYFTAMRVQYDSFDTCFPSPAASFEHVARWNPNIRNLVARVSKQQAEAFRDRYIAILEASNRATDGTFMANVDYAVITAVRSG